MKTIKVLLWLWLFLGAALSMSGQPYVLKGRLVDSVNAMPTIYTSLVVSRASDSIMVAFGRADADGKFSVSLDTPGRYAVLFGHPSFLPMKDEIDVHEPVVDLGDVYLLSQDRLLQEVIITDARAIVIKQDTIEYTADSFKTQAFDNVTELLKKLPGLEVDRSGKIKAQGQEVKKIYVDGEEFFSDDPAVVANTLRASSVDKVQVIDKKSEKAEFTGIDDGEKVKAINLQLKENAKKGYMGKVSLGGGLPDFWENMVSLQAYKAKRKMVLFGNMANTGNSDLNGSEMPLQSGDVMRMNGNNDNGYPKAWNGGGLYNNKWGENGAWELRSNFGANKKIVEAQEDRSTRYILPDTQYTEESHKRSMRQNWGEKARTSVEYKIDSTATLRMDANLSVTNTYNRSVDWGATYTLNGGTVNESKSDAWDKGRQQGGDIYLSYRKKMRKKGRSFMASFNGDYRETSGSGHLSSQNTLYLLDSINVIDQRKENKGSSGRGDLKLVYTEPLIKNVYCELNYGIAFNDQSNNNASYDKGGNGIEGDYDRYNPVNSSDYSYNTLENRWGGDLKLDLSKVNISFGTTLMHKLYRQEDRVMNSLMRYGNTNFSPQGSLRYNIGKQTSFNLNYKGTTNQPTLEQIQPLRENNTPLNIRIGNPDLRQEFRHSINLSYSDYKVMNSSFTFLMLGYSFVQDAITQKQNIDLSGIRTYQFVNISGNYNAYGNATFSRDAPFAKIRMFANLGANINSNNNIINDVNSRTTSWSVSPGLRLSYDESDEWDISYGVNPRYSQSISSVRKDLDNSFKAINQSFSGTLRLWKFQLITKIEWDIKERLNPQDRNNNICMWDVHLKRTINKSGSLAMQLSAFDLLNMRSDYMLNYGNDMITESTSSVIKRFVLLSVVWNFTKTGGPKATSDDKLLLND